MNVLPPTTPYFSLRRAWAASAVLACVAVLVGASGCAKTVRAYDGPGLAEGQFATVRNGNDVYVEAIDGERVEGSPSTPWSYEYQLAPGDHRLAVEFYRSTTVGGAMGSTASVTTRGVNLMTIRHRFEAGRRYSFGLLTTAAGWEPMLVELGGGPEGDRVVARMEVGLGPAEGTAGPARAGATPGPGAGGATVSGTAEVQAEGGMLYTAAGREVRLIPRTDAAEAWLGKLVERRRNPPPVPWPGPSEPAEVRSGGRRTMGYGTGQFAFEGVPPGEYFVVFDPQAPAAGVVGGVVTVRPGAGEVSGVELRSAGRE